MHHSEAAFDVSIDNSFDFLSAEYATLFDNSVATAFQHPLWLDSLYRNLASAGGTRRLILVVRRRRGGELALVLPLVRVRRGPLRTVEFADVRVSDYLAPICSESNFVELVQDAAACREMRRLLRPFDLLRVPKLRDGSVSLERLLDAPTRASMDTNAYAVELKDSFADWRAGALDRSYQKELAKKLRQLQRKGDVRFTCEDTPDIVATLEMMKQYRGPRFHARGDGDLLQRPEYFAFYSDIALRGAGSFSRLYAMRMDGRVIAAVLGLCHKATFLVIMGAFDIEGFKSQSIGSLMFERVAMDCIERKDRVLDFTIGDEPYKKLFGAQPSPMWAITRTGSAAGSLAGFALEQAPWLKMAARRMAGLRLLPARG
ncbi:GNAT family N-acetyltransferase [Bradyrhizobium sp.]|uniref:GNAT family N-acetyltransferase n=1 Tax=Bradyrhizobium sp. TaxID=376 RepID=UPI0040379CA8